MKHVYYIVNLKAGKAALHYKLGTILDMMTKAGMEVTMHPTQAPQDAAISAAAAAETGRYDYIFCSGGDGTLNEVLSGMMQAKHRMPIGYIPCGSQNDFARSIGIPKDLLKAAEAVINGVPRSFDIGTVNGRSFNYITAFGAFTDVTYDTPQSVKNVFGSFAYVMNSLTKITNIQSYPMRITCDGQVLEDEFVYGMVTNSASVGGLLNINDFYFDDGLFEITLVKRPENPIELQRALSFLRDIRQLSSDAKMFCLRASEIRIELMTDMKVPWTVDGEYLENQTEFKVINHKRALSLLVPAAAESGCFMEEAPSGTETDSEPSLS